MSLPENSQNSSISVLKSDDLIEIFGYLNFNELITCRRVCSFWYKIIRDTSHLNDRLCFRLEFGRGFVVDRHEPPLSLILHSKIKIEKLTFWNDFFEAGKSIATVTANREKLQKLLHILREMNVTETLHDLMMQTRDDEPRTNSLLFEHLICGMKNLKYLRFSLPSFVHAFETLLPSMNSNPPFTIASIEKVEIFHETFRRLIADDFRRMLKIFPNTKEIHIYPSVSMLLDKSIIQTFAPLIKTITNLEHYTIKDIMNIENLALDHLEFPDPCESSRVLRFIQEHPEIKSASLLVDYSSVDFMRPYDMITTLIIQVDAFEIDEFDDESNPEYMYNILRFTPNLKRLQIEFPKAEEHNFGHTEIDLPHLEEVEVTQIELDCQNCCLKLLKSCVNTKTLTLKDVSQHLEVVQMQAIAQTLVNLENVSIFYEYDEELGNLFEEWPEMPKLRHLTLNKVGVVTIPGIRTLQASCPLLQTLKLYSIRNTNMKELLQEIANKFPDIVDLTLRGGRTQKVSNLSEIFAGGKGWRLKTLDISPDLEHSDILQLFKQLDFLQVVTCKFGALVVTRRIYYEVTKMKAYKLDEIVQPMKSRKRIHLDADDSSDSETSSSEMSDDDDDDYDSTDTYNSDDMDAENDIIVL
ncbi:uncharacterized protein LOC134833476 [Culicoides brevitarsis]|uniref:uncharacterized protein LOC134833476 n=1 Tax=Culicoides brevitarsis TaxID=469753 RepID=UPI00307C3064